MSPEEVRTFSGPAIPSALTSPEEVTRSAAATPATVMSPLSLWSSTLAEVGTSRR